MTALDYLRTWRRRWRIVLVCALFGAAIGYFLSPARVPASVPQFEAKVTMVPAIGTAPAANIYLAASVAGSDDVARLAAIGLGETEAALKGAVTAAADPQAYTLTIKTLQPSPERAGAVVQAFASATAQFLVTSTSEARKADADDAARQAAAVQKNVDQLKGKLAKNPNDKILSKQLDLELGRYSVAYDRLTRSSGSETAPAYTAVGGPQITRSDPGGISAPRTREGRAAAAGLLGLALGMMIALAVDRMDTRLQGPARAEDTFDLPVLAEIPRISRKSRRHRQVTVVSAPDGIVAEGYRSLRSAVNFLGHIRHAHLAPHPVDPLSDLTNTPPKVVVVAGPRGGDGKTTTVANLAAAIAETGKSVIVIDCDFRNPQMQRFLRDAPAAEAREGQLARATAIGGVRLIRAGDGCGDAGSMLRRLPEIITYVRGHADVALIDSGPLLVVSDAVDLLQHADAALVTCRVGRTTAEEATRARMLLQRANVPLAGVVLLGAAGPGNRKSLSEPATWSLPRGRRPVAGVAALAWGDQPHDVEPVPQAGQWSAAPSPRPAAAGDPYPLALGLTPLPPAPGSIGHQRNNSGMTDGMGGTR